MTCFHPLKAFVVGTKANGKSDLRIKKYETQFIYHMKEDKYRSGDDTVYLGCKDSPCANVLNCDEKLCDPDRCDNFVLDMDNPLIRNSDHVVWKYYTIPCGQCKGCRIQYSRVWANRMMLEAKMSHDCWFVTLTYDDDHIPTKEYVSEDTGEIQHSYSLVKRDLQLFNKRLRKKFGEGIRFYACGEYGSNTLRPHYHIIYFNLGISVRSPVVDPTCIDPVSGSPIFVPGKNEPLKSRKGFDMFVCDDLYELWDKGLHTVQPVNWKTCAYVARYVMKKQKGATADRYEYFNIEPEFSLMSRKPGIGKLWYDENGEKAYETDIIRLSLPEGALSFRPPGYYDDLYDIDHPIELLEIKENRRKMMVDLQKLKLSKTTMSFLEYLACEEYNFSHRINSLVRE